MLSTYMFGRHIITTYVFRRHMLSTYVLRKTCSGIYAHPMYAQECVPCTHMLRKICSEEFQAAGSHTAFSWSHILCDAHTQATVGRNHLLDSVRRIT